jgi:hypothetical protein
MKSTAILHPHNYRNMVQYLRKEGTQAGNMAVEVGNMAVQVGNMAEPLSWPNRSLVTDHFHQ